MLLSLSPFAGIAPKLDPVLLRDGLGQVASNVRLGSGALEPINSTLEVVAAASIGISPIKTIYRFGQSEASDINYWMAWNTDVHVVKGQIYGDTTERTYYTGSSYPRQTDAAMALGAIPRPTSSYRLGAPRPTQIAISSVTGAGTGQPESRVYVQTWVTYWGEECANSIPSAVVSVLTGQTVALSLGTGPSGNYSITNRRIYRAVAAASGANVYLFVAELPLATTTYDDTIVGSSLGYELTTGSYDMLPNDAHHLIAMPNGMMAAALGNDIYFCEPYKGYAWPVGYMMSTEFPVVGLGVYGNTLVACTTARPVLFTGVHSANISPETPALDWGCASHKSIQSMRMGALGDGVVWASPKGLCFLGGAAREVLSDAAMTEREWRAYKPETFIAGRWGDRYVAFFDKGSNVKGALIFDPANGFTESSVYADATYTDPVTNHMYVAIDQAVHKWDGSTALTYVYRGGRRAHMRPIKPYVWCQVIADNFPVTVRVYADSTLRATVVAANKDPFRLPMRGFTARNWEIEVESQYRVQDVFVAHGIEEIRAKLSQG